ncbi:vWA domain-containing protein [Sharpea azabuensis]|uniref:vWA domain-containing protein n=1 Tax=Sharpea azabuensis TaxID=322505 RepID=UPI002409686F|nr:VWA domain-containing protein [Sharpea azabuensis]MDD6512919.1 VWA domain-containing protein [Sharpea azabuensis]
MKQIIKKYCALLIALAMVLPVMSVRAFAAAQPSTKDGPAVEKIVTDNGDGTHKIKLELTGKVNTTHEVTKANVLVVLDLSGSMKETAGTTTRLKAAKSAVNSVAETLLGKNGKNGAPNDLVEMGLVTFGSTAETRLSKTTSVSTFTNTVNGLSAYSGNYAGTNWEAALASAQSFNFGDKDKTYVIFVSDGNPTFRNTRGNYHTGHLFDRWERWDSSVYSSLGVYGDGSDTNATNVQRAYEQSLDEAKGIVDSHRELYTIGCFGNVNRMQGLTNHAYSSSDSDKYYSASDSAQLSDALDKIATAISNSLGQSNVKVTDGVTSLSKISANVDGTPSNFVYKKNGAVWANAPAAKIVDSKVVWDLSSVGALENNAKYSVEFDVWPSQDAFDLVADLNNGKQTYDSLSNEIKSQLKKDEDTGKYFLNTNTDLRTNFTYNNQDLEEKFDAGDNSMEVLSSTISLEKLWENNLDNRSAEPVTLNLTKDGNVYLTKELDEDNNFKLDNIYVAPGIMRDGKVLVTGHDYSVTEPADSAYHWELNADTYHPMLIDGKLTMLKKDDNGTYTIDGKKYSVVDAADATLKAKNSRRSYLNFTKKVTEAQANTASKDDLFSYNVTINAADNKEVWFAVKDENGNYVTNLETTATQDGDYYKVDSGKEFTVKLKRNWNFRAINLLSNTTYSIEETDIPDGYVFENYQINEGNINVEGNKVTGIIAAANKAYTLTNTNKYNGYFYVYHSSNNQVEKVSITDPRVVDGKFDLTKEVSNGYLYGGYFKAYGQTTSTNDQIKALTYTDGKATDPNGTAYTGSKSSAWKAANAYKVNGKTDFAPEVNHVYFLKEVPNAYFRPRMEVIYDTRKSTQPVTNLYIFTATDDANYSSVSLSPVGKTKLYSSAVIRNYDGTVKKYLTVRGEFKPLSRGYIALLNVKDKVKNQTDFEFTPTYETLDGVEVSGVVKRTVAFGNGSFVPGSNGDTVAPGLHHTDVNI